MKTETPETDAAWDCIKGYMESLQNAKDLCQKLECERDDLRKRIGGLCVHLGIIPANATLLVLEVLRMVRERDEARKDATFWQSLAEGRGRADDGDTGKAMTDQTMKKEHHPLAARLNNHLRQFSTMHELYADIRGAANLIDDQHTAISKAFEAVLDNDMQACTKILADSSNEYPFLTDEEKKERKTP